jgi:MYXO-CTERM domain-containing protein
MNLFRPLLIASFLAASLGASSLAFADVPPTCSEFDNDVTCSAADVGKACSGGGTCYEVYCSSQSGGNGTQQNLYKCETCPTILDVDAGGADCTGPGGSAAYGSTCAGDAGTCEKLPEYCPTPNTTTYLWCVEDGTGTMHVSGGSSSGGSSGGSSSSGSSSGGSSSSGSSSGGTSDGGSVGGPKDDNHGSSSSGGGCAMTPDASRGWFTAALGLAGVVALGLGRQRRRRPRR